MLRLYVIRHGQVSSNTEMRYVGHRDEELTERGRSQAAALAEVLAPLPLAALIASPMRRTISTAELVAAPHGLAVTPDERLREQAFGAWEGLTRTEVRDLSARHADHLARWQADPEESPPDGESLATVQSRILDLVAELAAASLDRPAALVTHVGPIKALLCAVLGLPLTGARRMFLDPGTVSVVDWGDEPLLRLFNSHAHLGWENARWLTPTQQSTK